MRPLTHLLLAPSSRLVRLVIAEKRLSYDLSAEDDPRAHLPVLTETVGMRLEGSYSDIPLTPEDPEARAEALRWLDWSMFPLQEQDTQKIVYEKAAQRFT